MTTVPALYRLSDFTPPLLRAVSLSPAVPLLLTKRIFLLFVFFILENSSANDEFSLNGIFFIFLNSDLLGT